MKNKFTALESELHVVKWLLTTLLNTLKLQNENAMKMSNV